MPTSNEIVQQVQRDGFAITQPLLSDEQIQRFIDLTEAARTQEREEVVANQSGAYGLRNLMDVIPEVIELARLPAIAELITRITGPGAGLIRATLFDKTPDANWAVFWHRDQSIAVRQREEVAGFSGWTRKAGTHCVQPPKELMQRVIAARIHLDDCTHENGALKVLPGTHEISETDNSSELENERSEMTCEVAAGGLVLMRPLILHASSRMTHPSHRRVIHLEFAAFELPDPLRWRWFLPCVSNTKKPA